MPIAMNHAVQHNSNIIARCQEPHLGGCSCQPHSLPSVSFTELLAVGGKGQAGAVSHVMLVLVSTAGTSGTLMASADGGVVAVTLLPSDCTSMAWLPLSARRVATAWPPLDDTVVVLTCASPVAMEVDAALPPVLLDDAKASVVRRRSPAKAARQS